MIFKIRDNKLHEVKLHIENEDKFVKEQTTEYTKFIKVDKIELPKPSKDLLYTKLFYKLEDDRIVLDLDRIEATYKKDNKEKLPKQVIKLINSKRQELKNYIIGFKIDDKQEEAYELKYQVAKRYLDTSTDEDKAKLQSEANFRGLSVDDLAKLIVKKHDEWVSELEIFSQKIELFRIAFNDLLANEKYEKAKEVLKNAKELNIDSTDEDILDLFK